MRGTPRNVMNKFANLIENIREIFEHKKPSDEPFNNDLDKWNLFCVAMDTLEDTYLVLEFYENSQLSNNEGEKYLKLYGLLQAMFLQQDSIRNLYKILLGTFPKNNSNLLGWNRIRELRNLTVGHPLEKKDKSGVKRCYISRVTISKQGFQYLIWDRDKQKGSFVNANLEKALSQYKKEAVKILDKIYLKLSDKIN